MRCWSILHFEVSSASINKSFNPLPHSKVKRKNKYGATALRQAFYALTRLEGKTLQKRDSGRRISLRGKTGGSARTCQTKGTHLPRRCIFLEGGERYALFLLNETCKTGPIKSKLEKLRKYFLKERFTNRTWRSTRKVRNGMSF